MQRSTWYATSTLALAILVTACYDSAPHPVEPDTFTTPVVSAHGSMNGAMGTDNFTAHAQGDEEVPAVDTRAQGQAVFRLSDDGDELTYRLIVANIQDVLMAHIHRAPAGSNGPVVAWLYPAGPPPELIPGRTQGVLAEGIVTADDLVGPLEGMDLGALVSELRAGNGYVNVHTDANPAGEIRGQIH